MMLTKKMYSFLIVVVDHYLLTFVYIKVNNNSVNAGEETRAQTSDRH